MLKSIAHKLAEIRKSKGLSQADVYIDTDLNIGHIEAGRKNVTISSLAILCKYYGITLEEFFRGIDRILRGICHFAICEEKDAPL